jgi:hypothetical protein
MPTFLTVAICVCPVFVASGQNQTPLPGYDKAIKTLVEDAARIPGRAQTLAMLKQETSKIPSRDKVVQDLQAEHARIPPIAEQLRLLAVEAAGILKSGTKP